jgi:hypothetical protein
MEKNVPSQHVSMTLLKMSEENKYEKVRKVLSRNIMTQISRVEVEIHDSELSRVGKEPVVRLGCRSRIIAFLLSLPAPLVVYLDNFASR